MIPKIYFFVKEMDKISANYRISRKKDTGVNKRLTGKTDNAKKHEGFYWMGRNSKLPAEGTATCIAFSNSLLHTI